MNIHHQDNTTKVIHGDCIETMNQMEPESVDAIVTDPPYGLGFMGKKWDDLPPSQEWADACYRVLKPGGHIAAFGGTRTWHRLAVAIEDAGFEMRDSLAWLYGSGFPKSHDVGKAIDKAAGAEREAGTLSGRSGSGRTAMDAGNRSGDLAGDYYKTAPATPEAAQWDGWGTALKPAFEPIVLARKPLAEKTVARNVLTHGTGAINVDATRVGYRNEADRRQNDVAAPGMRESRSVFGGGLRASTNPSGRWPANVLLDQHAAAWVDEQSGESVSRKAPRGDGAKMGYHGGSGTQSLSDGHNDSGGASRFFYTAKAPRSERPNVDGVQHPTVKPLAIMEWLISLVTPPGGTALDPFAGSGTTIEAARKLGHKSIGVEAEEDYLLLIDQRLQRSNTSPIELEGIG